MKMNKSSININKSNPKRVHKELYIMTQVKFTQIVQVWFNILKSINAIHDINSLKKVRKASYQQMWKKHLTKITHTHEKNFQQTDCRGELSQHDRGCLKNPTPNIIVNFEILEAFLQGQAHQTSMPFFTILDTILEVPLKISKARKRNK